MRFVVAAPRSAPSSLCFFCANTTDTRDFGALDFEFQQDVVLSSLVWADASHFVGEVKMDGGVVRVDETKKTVDVTPCQLAP